MAKNAYKNLPPSLGPMSFPPYITHARLIHQPNTRSLRFAIETALTLLIWAALVYLVVIYIGGQPAQAHGGWLMMLSHFAYNIGLIALFYLLLLAVGMLLMSIWATFNKHLARHKPQVRVAELEQRRLMRAFDVSRTMFERLNQSNVVTIFHDEAGEIESIRIGCQIPEDGGLSQLPPETFMPTAWNENSQLGSDEFEPRTVADRPA
ncbi:poly-beta-1,6-N-acetyl-D-glucosamine biosynthesis protein PgaD [Lampropedia aestuarii]|uniref:Poly-beta-1,6-N-acetyl-D-glucosamine biosynthesis protein PgaD n=1 Tax=Lampropedia aestuarii TaxID=2562762 RepID=A0A4V6S757_9BURK|nr:poly-beta-1,6-N-acetyl-D-glucosamine biosynthesis protein PgaD [Lampropedia aestuarii]MDH5857628.1 poly-beta-1,6-N-acetyl-D-glucosamine biosynthesis protein PgaD [Lampropedia aestuarii]THJ30782.1 poly-beta-1,6-N-acetyl-D-glucosamine biosynthesis protein PgaD [Lampropedia aestuarii]